jgi:hypothetical protein
MDKQLAYTAILSTRAQKEIIESWNWYEERQQGLGDRFLNEVIKSIHSIEQDPESYGTKYKSYKETSINIFPFLIIYIINKRKNLVKVISIFHTSLNQKKKY